MKKVILLLVLLASVTFCFAEEQHVQIANDSVALEIQEQHVQIANDSVALETHERHKEQQIKVIRYVDWGYKDYLLVPSGWHVVAISANDRVVVVVLERN